MEAFSECFGCHTEEISRVEFEVAHKGADLVRTTQIFRSGDVQQSSEPTAIRRS